MPLQRLRIPRSWRSTAVAILVGLIAPLIILTAPGIEARLRRLQFAEDTHATTSQAMFDRLDMLLYDSLFQFRGPHAHRLAEDGKPVPSIPEVVIITLDHNGVETINDLYRGIGSHGPPLPRRVYADLLRKLAKAESAVVGLDVLFTSPSSYNRSATDNNDDQEFAQALKESGNVVIGCAANATQQAGADFEVQNQDFPIPILRKSARAICPVNVPRDNLDKFVRRFHLSELAPEDFDMPERLIPYPTFATMVAALYWKQRQTSDTALKSMGTAAFDQLLKKELKQGRFIGRQLPFHRQNSQALHDSESVNICFAGYPGATTCAIRSIGEVMDPNNQDLLTTWFRNKIVLVGSWAADEHDHYGTPLLRRVGEIGASGKQQDQRILDENGESEIDHRYGVEVHANIIHTLLAQHFYRDVDENWRLTLIWICGLVTALLVARLRPVIALVPIAGLLALVYWLTVYAFSHFVVLMPVQVGLSVVVAYGLEAIYFYSIENRRATRARSTFQRYVGPKVMQKVLDTDFKTGTVESRYLTIMFTDVQGFTSLSEKMSPREVVDTFNRYLNEMADIIDKYDGVLDKIMGDGVMAYFNAPHTVENHEQVAVECALEMQAAMRSWRKLSEELALPPLKVRIGINAGEVVFGEVGAKRQVGYTVIGDAVNAAARLEPLNKEFGTEILISEIVRSKLDDTFETEYVGELAIRGREEGIRAYSVTGRKTVAS